MTRAGEAESGVPPRGGGLDPGERETLVSLLREEAALMRRFSEVARAQAEILAGEDVDDAAFEMSVADGAEVSGRFGALAARSEELLRNHRAGGAKDAVIDALCGEIASAAAAAADLNTGNTAAARAKLGEYGEKITRMSDTRRGVTGYGEGEMLSSPSLFDRLV